MSAGLWMKIMFVILFVLSGAGLFWKGQRRFNRLNSFGVVIFTSFIDMVFFKTTQAMLGIFSIIGLGLGFFGFCLAIAFNGFMK